ncbi:MAG: hypothetical protein J6M05_02560 [Cardiobacteriaceae bacterium]|nr:hypothetical protein [Cardiobacteriaceae bacterium]
MQKKLLAMLLLGAVALSVQAQNQENTEPAQQANPQEEAEIQAKIEKGEPTINATQEELQLPSTQEAPSKTDINPKKSNEIDTSRPPRSIFKNKGEIENQEAAEKVIKAIKETKTAEEAADIVVAVKSTETAVEAAEAIEAIKNPENVPAEQPAENIAPAKETVPNQMPNTETAPKTEAVEKTEQAAEVEKVEQAPEQKAVTNTEEAENLVPTTQDLGIPKPEFSEKLITKKAQDYKDEFKFTADKEPKTLYFSAEGKLTDKADEKGYYRQVLGKDENGLLVAQDFYQDTKTPQTNKFLVRKDGNVEDFSVSENQGLVAWYNRKGILTSALILDEESNPLTMQAHYKNGKLIAQVDTRSQVFYYDDGATILGYLVESPEGRNDLTLYRTDGQAYARFVLQGGEFVRGETKFWNQSGELVLPDEKSAESTAQLMQRVFQIIDEIQNAEN